jgi:eight-cysteine-cluster-containing protein
MKYLILILIGLTIQSCEETCVVGGCSSQLCTEKPTTQESGMISTCEFQEYYSCFSKTTCEKIEGSCGWKPSEEFKKCLTEKGAPQSVIEKYQ